jgi:hypothetical protein
VFSPLSFFSSKVRNFYSLKLFMTRGLFLRKVTWTTITYEPDSARRACCRLPAGRV